MEGEIPCKASLSSVLEDIAQELSPVLGKRKRERGEKDYFFLHLFQRLLEKAYVEGFAEREPRVEQDHHFCYPTQELNSSSASANFSLLPLPSPHTLLFAVPVDG